MSLPQKVHSIRTAPDHLWYNRLDWHIRSSSRQNVEEQLCWLHTCCEHYCMIEQGIALRPDHVTLWFESESDAIQWDLAQS